MKLVISKDEVIRMLKVSIALPDSAEIEFTGMERQESVGKDKYLGALLRITQVDFPQYGGAQKIPAIKALREQAGCGLAEAKYAIENPEAAMRFFVRNGEFYQGIG